MLTKDTCNQIFHFVDVNLISCLIPIILTLFLIDKFFKGRFETKRSLNLIRWIIISYTFFILMITLVESSLSSSYFSFINRAVGSYAFWFWIMFLCSLTLPFTLFIKKLSRSFLYVLMVAFFMKIGNHFERFVIVLTTYQRDALGGQASLDVSNLFARGTGVLIFQGTLIAVIILIFFEVILKTNGLREDILDD